ncbi:hypothetical protein CNEO3_180059 [Clostridium neonatale]|nr:hypothetical protein CNEO3_180059 [Clostridium neonatale]
MLDYIKVCEARSVFKRNVNLNKGDKIMKLITCTYETDNSHTLVKTKLIN